MCIVDYHNLTYIHSYINFDIFVSHQEQFCNGSKIAAGNLMERVYFQYRTNNRIWITVDNYNG